MGLTMLYNNFSAPTAANQAAWDAFCDQFLLETGPAQEPSSTAAVPAPPDTDTTDFTTLEIFMNNQE